MSRFVGLDLGLKSPHRAVVLDAAEVRGKPFAVKMTREGVDNLLARAADGTDGPVSFVMEPTGLVWLPVAALASAAGHRIYLSKPQKLSDLRKFYRKHTKTDVVDAEAAGRLPQMDPNGVHELSVPTAEQTTFRRLVKRRERLSRESADHKRRVHAALGIANPGLVKALGEEKFTSPKVAFLRKYVDPEKVIRLGKERLRRFWTRHSNGQHDPAVVDRVWESCRTALDLYAGLRAEGKLPFDYVAIQDDVDFELAEMERKDRQVGELDGRIDEIYRTLDPDRTLEQLRGVGPVIAATVEALIGDVNRFPNSKCFVSYCGLCPRKNQTGVSDPSMPITKTGQRLLKKYLYLAADVARQWDPDFASYYASRYAAGDHHNLIVIALARKMACRMYALMKRREKARESDGQGTGDAYVLRDEEGNELTKKAARALVVAKYTRAIVAPERHNRERRRKGKAENPTTAKVSGRPEDATAPTVGSPSEPVPAGTLLKQALPGLLENT